MAYLQLSVWYFKIILTGWNPSWLYIIFVLIWFSPFSIFTANLLQDYFTFSFLSFLVQLKFSLFSHSISVLIPGFSCVSLLHCFSIKAGDLFDLIITTISFPLLKYKWSWWRINVETGGRPANGVNVPLKLMNVNWWCAPLIDIPAARTCVCHWPEPATDEWIKVCGRRNGKCVRFSRLTLTSIWIMKAKRKCQNEKEKLRGEKNIYIYINIHTNPQ